MSILSWKYPASRQEIYTAGTFARVAAATSAKGDKLPELDFPWDIVAPVEHVTPEERAALAASLRSRSAFGQKRTEVTDG